MVRTENLVPFIEIILDEMSYCRRSEVNKALIATSLMHISYSFQFICLVEYFKHVLVRLFKT